MNEDRKDNILRAIFILIVTGIIAAAAVLQSLAGNWFVGLSSSVIIYALIGFFCALIGEADTVKSFLGIVLLWWPIVAFRKFAEKMLDKLYT